jgi:hypothetical protein
MFGLDGYSDLLSAWQYSKNIQEDQDWVAEKISPQSFLKQTYGSSQGGGQPIKV